MSAKLDFADMLEAARGQSELGSPPEVAIAQQWVAAAQGDALLSAIALDILAHAHQHMSDHSAAQAAFRAAVAAFLDAGKSSKALNSLVLLGTSFLIDGRPMLALEQWSKALVSARDLGELRQCSKIYMGISQVYIGLGHDETALHYNEMALKIANNLGDTLLQCETQLFVASDYFRLQRYTEALAAIDNAEHWLGVPVINKVWSAEVIYYRGMIHAAQGLLEQAKIELETAYALSSQNENLWGSVHALSVLGEVLLQLQDQGCESVFRQALALCIQVSMPALTKRCANGLIQLYLQQNRPEMALPLYAYLFESHQEVTQHLSPRHRQRITQLETRSRILQLQRSVTEK